MSELKIPRFTDLGGCEKLEERRRTNTNDEFKAENQAKKIEHITQVLSRPNSSSLDSSLPPPCSDLVFDLK